MNDERGKPRILRHKFASRAVLVFPAFLDLLVSSRSCNSAGRRLTMRGNGAAQTTGKTTNAKISGKGAHYKLRREITGVAALRSRVMSSVPALCPIYPAYTVYPLCAVTMARQTRSRRL